MLLFNTHLSHTTKTSLLHAQLSPGTADLACSGACEGTSSRQPEMLCSVQLALGSPASGGRAATQDSPKQQQLKSLFSCRVQLVSLPPILLTDVRKKSMNAAAHGCSSVLSSQLSHLLQSWPSASEPSSGRCCFFKRKIERKEKKPLNT